MGDRTKIKSMIVDRFLGYIVFAEPQNWHRIQSIVIDKLNIHNLNNNHLSILPLSTSSSNNSSIIFYISVTKHFIALEGKQRFKNTIKPLLWHDEAINWI